MTRLIALVLLAVAALPAMDTALIINSTNGTASVIVNPSLGTMTYYLMQDGALTRRSSANFLADLEFADRMIVQSNTEEAISALRMGSNTKPLYPEFFKSILEKLDTTKTEKAAGIEPLHLRARRSEKEWWSKEHPYDGVVRAAMSQNYLMLAIPAKRALLVYEVASEDFKLVAWRYWGTELYLPHVYGSNPTPAEILNQLPSDLQEERKKALEEQYKALTESKSQTIDTKPSDAWIAAGAGERFAVLDIPNNHLMAYEYTGKSLDLKSIRNIEVDLMIPSAFRSTPDLNEIFKQWSKDRTRQAWLKEMGMENDVEAFKVYVESKQAAGAGKTSPLQANVILNTGDLTLDFGDKRKAAVYRFAGGTPTMDLMSFRDYTFDVGVSLLDGEIRQKAAARQLFDMAKGFKDARNAFLNLRSALQMDPLLYREVEKDKRLVDRLKDQPGWAEAIEKASAEGKKLEDEIKRRQEEAQKRREEKAKKKAGG